MVRFQDVTEQEDGNCRAIWGMLQAMHQRTCQNFNEMPPEMRATLIPPLAI